jgi:protein ImuA
MLSQPPLIQDRGGLLAQLQQQIRNLEGEKPLAQEQQFSTGCPELDALFPDGGPRPGSVVEWLSPGPGSGALGLSLLAAQGAIRRGGAIVICDREQICYPPALVGLGIDLARVILVRAQDAADHRWAIDQALRSPAVAVVSARLEKLDDKTSRRFQLAAEIGGALGLLIRPHSIRGQPTWADVQLALAPLASGGARQWRVECVRARGPTAATCIDIEWNETTGQLRAVSSQHETHSLPVVGRLARAAGA